MKQFLKLIGLLFVVFGFHRALAVPAKPDSDMSKVLKALDAKGGKPIESLTAEEARRQPSPTDAVKTVMSDEKKTPPTDSIFVKEIKVQGQAGMIPARLYSPPGQKTALPIVVYFHGGGFVLASNDTYDATPRSLAAQTGAIFVSVEYRKAPESKFPAAHEDAFAAYKWVLGHAGTFGGDPRNVAVAGESAGANLALNVAIRARDEKIQMPVHELLVYPVASNNLNSESYKDYAAAKPLNKPMMEWFVKQYTRTPEDAKDPRINLVSANLKGLNPATVITAQIDPLLDDGKALVEKLKSDGVKVEYKNYPGVTHEFFGMASVVKEAKNAQKFASDELKSALKR
jgi:acetyl esterase